MLKRIIVSFSLLIYIVSASIAQDGSNPFDLPERERIATETDNIERTKTNNPFDLQPVASNGAKIEVNKEKPSNQTTSKLSTTNQGGRIGISLVMVILLALLLTLFRGVFNDFLESAYRDRKFNQFFRRQNSMWIVPNILLYIYFFLSVSVFTHLALSHYGYEMFQNVVKSIGFLIISIGSFFSIKHALIYFLGDTFEVKNEATRYSLLILTFNIILGVFLTPINLLLLLGPDALKGGVVIFGLLLCGGMILLLMLRSLSVSNRLLIQHSLHFFMYLCTIEIAPLFIVAKLLT